MIGKLIKETSYRIHFSNSLDSAINFVIIYFGADDKIFRQV